MLLQRRIINNFVVGRIGNTEKIFTIGSSSRGRNQRVSSDGVNFAKMSSACQPEKALIAISQMRSTSDKAANMRQVKELVAQAKAQGATFLFLPECCDFVGEHRQQSLELSEPLTGATMEQYRELAKNNGLWLSLGGIHESILDAEGCKTDKIHNAHVLVNAEGEVVCIYRKLHLFDVSTPEFRFNESDIVAAGPHLVRPVNTPIGCLGLQICYDMRFAETSLLLRKMGAQVLTYPSAFAYSTGKAHWEVLLRARAIENQCYVVAPAQVGFHNKKRQSWGHGMVVSPWGKVIVDCGGETELAVVTAEIDIEAIEAIKRSMPCFEHRRGDAYSLTSYNVGLCEAQKDRLFGINVIRKETIFYETEHCYAFTNLRCVVKGHVLVSTKRVLPRLNGLTCEEMADLFSTVCKIQRMLEAIHQTHSATVTVQDGPDAGQTVPHVHFHVMPRRPNDFGHNDQVYVQLDDRCDNQPDRSIDERIAESQQYRQFLQSE